MGADGEMTASIGEIKRRVELRLDEFVPAAGPGRLCEAMRYSLLAPAKRVRAILAVLAAEHCGGRADDAVTAAAALEMVHAASLILDDLPAMDDASMRRGRPTAHREFGEDSALLAAIALMNGAFAVIAAEPTYSHMQKMALVAILAQSIGPAGLTGGQELDLKGGRAGRASVDAIEHTHALKTGALFAAAGQAGAIVAQSDGATVERMGRFGDRLGVAFQAIDDLLDAHASAESIGKDVARDTDTATVVGLIGRAAAAARAEMHVGQALAALGPLTVEPTRLRQYVGQLVQLLSAPLATAGAGSEKS